MNSWPVLNEALSRIHDHRLRSGDPEQSCRVATRSTTLLWNEQVDSVSVAQFRQALRRSVFRGRGRVRGGSGDRGFVLRVQFQDCDKSLRRCPPDRTAE